MLERDELAYELFAAMRARGLRADMHDLNIALGAVAKADPAAGVVRLRKMIKNKLGADAVSFGTVIHNAAQRRDAATVYEIVRMADEAGTPLDYKTFARLIQANLDGTLDGARPLPDDDPATHTTRLERARSLLDAMRRGKLTPSPRLAMACVHAALRAGDSLGAVRFWHRMVRFKLGWNDREQIRLRTTLARAIVTDEAVGAVMEEWALYELGFQRPKAVARLRESVARREQEQEQAQEGGEGRD